MDMGIEVKYLPKNPTPYKFILAWCALVDAQPYFTERQLQAAAEDHAPLDAYSQRPDGTWRTLEKLEVTDPRTARLLRRYAELLPE